MITKTIIENAIVLLEKGWRNPTSNKGLMVHEALIRSFYKHTSLLEVADNQSLREALRIHWQPYYDAACLVYQADDSVCIQETDAKSDFLFPFYIDLYEWNNRNNQNLAHIIKTLQLASREAK